jgi:hypothetical protein
MLHACEHSYSYFPYSLIIKFKLIFLNKIPNIGLVRYLNYFYILCVMQMVNVKYYICKSDLSWANPRIVCTNISICSEKAARAAASQIIGIQGSIVLKSNKPRQIARTTGSFFVSVATGS